MVGANGNKIRLLGIISILGVGILATAYLVRSRTGEFDIRKKAALMAASQFIFRTPQVATVGKSFSVDVLLDTTSDPNYTISGADALITYTFTPDGPKPTCARPRRCPRYLPPCEDGQLVDIGMPADLCSCPPTMVCMKKGTTSDTKVTITGAPGKAQSGVTVNPFGSSNDGALPPSEVMPPIPPEYAGVTLVSVTPGSIFDMYPNHQRPPPSAKDLEPLPPSGTGGGGGAPAELCGGITGLTCLEGYECKYASGKQNNPDETGVCTSLGGKRPPTGQTGTMVNISGIKNYSVDDKKHFQGFTGQGVFAKLTFVANQPGTLTLDIVYKGPNATDDSNITGFLKDQPASLQKPSERLISAVQSGKLVVKRLQVFPTPIATIVQTTIPPSTIRPTPTCMPLPKCASQGEWVDGRLLYCDLVPEYLGGPPYCPRGTPTPTPVSTETVNIYVKITTIDGKPLVNTPIGLFAERVDVSPKTMVQGVSVFAAGFGDLNTNSGGGGGRVGVTSVPVGSNQWRDHLLSIGSAQTGPDGSAIVSVTDASVFKRLSFGSWRLYVQTPKHLIKAMTTPISVTFVRGQVKVGFAGLIPGDIAIAPRAPRQDSIVNTADIAELFAQWSGQNELVGGPNPPVRPDYVKSTPADLNDDGTINNRDLAVMLVNFGRKGDAIGPQEVFVTTGSPR